MAAGRSVCRFRFLFFFHVICNTFVFCQFISSIRVCLGTLLFLLYTICYQRAKHIANAKSTHLSALTDKNFLQCHRLLLDRFPILHISGIVQLENRNDEDLILRWYHSSCIHQSRPASFARFVIAVPLAIDSIDPAFNFPCFGPFFQTIEFAGCCCISNGDSNGW